MCTPIQTHYIYMFIYKKIISYLYNNQKLALLCLEKQKYPIIYTYIYIRIFNNLHVIYMSLVLF